MSLAPQCLRGRESVHVATAPLPHDSRHSAPLDRITRLICNLRGDRLKGIGSREQRAREGPHSALRTAATSNHSPLHDLHHEKSRSGSPLCTQRRSPLHAPTQVTLCSLQSSPLLFHHHLRSRREEPGWARHVSLALDSSAAPTHTFSRACPRGVDTCPFIVAGWCPGRGRVLQAGSRHCYKLGTRIHSAARKGSVGRASNRCRGRHVSAARSSPMLSQSASADRGAEVPV